MIVCTFSGGLDDMKRKDQRDKAALLRKLSTMKAFSIFEVTDNQTIAKTMQSLVNQGQIKTTGGAFPWTTFEITPAGQAIIDANKEQSC